MKKKIEKWQMYEIGRYASICNPMDNDRKER